MLWIAKRAASACSASTSILTSSSLPGRFATSPSIAGPSARQGPRRAAQKSTTTGSSRERQMTSRSKVSVVTSICRPPCAGKPLLLYNYTTVYRISGGEKRMALPHPLPDELVELIARRFRVIGEPMRIRLLDRLREGEASVERADRGARRLAAERLQASRRPRRGRASSAAARRAPTSTTGSSTRASSPSASRSAARCSSSCAPSTELVEGVSR